LFSFHIETVRRFGFFSGWSRFRTISPTPIFESTGL
jgi:hypothetical protein